MVTTRAQARDKGRRMAVLRVKAALNHYDDLVDMRDKALWDRSELWSPYGESRLYRQHDKRVKRRTKRAERGKDLLHEKIVDMARELRQRKASRNCSRSRKMKGSRGRARR